MNQGEDLDVWENRFQKKRSKRPLLNLMCLLRTYPEETHVPMLLRLKRVVGMRFNCHLTPHLVGFLC